MMHTHVFFLYHDPLTWVISGSIL